jgi:hypothetical protein
MNRAGPVFGIGAVIVLVFTMCQATFAQDFPYAVPQAPEFDTGNSMLPPATVEEPAPEPKSYQPQQRKRSRSSGEPRTDYRTVRPYVPQETPPVSSYPQPTQPYQPPQPPAAAHPQAGHPAVASTPPGPPPQMEQQRLDCSKFPMLIAQARSEQEMQWQARLYLTCLVRSGWTEEQAKQQVISTIESTFRLAR